MALLIRILRPSQWRNPQNLNVYQISWASTAATQRKIEKCYETLNLKSDCTDDEIKDSYFRLAKEYHPDSTSTLADSVKFTQIEESYRYLLTHRKAKLQQQEEEYTMEEHQRFYDIKHTAPQHRQYLSNEGYGYGTPSQRQKQYNRNRVSKASESVFSYQYEREAAKAETAVVEKDKRITRQRTTRSTIDRVVDDYISESMRRGDFNNLTGTGKPLKRDYNPMVDGFTRHLNKMLINNGYAPEWITLDKEIRNEIMRAREKLWNYRLRLGPEPWPDYAKGLWKNYTHDFTAIVEEDINKKIDRFNLLAPALHLQTVHYNSQKEVSKVMKRYKELYVKGQLPHQRLESTRSNPIQYHTVLEEEPWQISWREIWINIKAVFKRSRTT